MKDVFPSTEINNLFRILLHNKIPFLLLRNINNELPYNLSRDKDIDILIHPSAIIQAHRTFISSGWRQIRHPWDFGNNFVFLYSMPPFRMYKRKGLHIDVTYQLACRSPNRGEWTPLDKVIQDSAWENCREEIDLPWRYRLGYKDEMIHLLTRCIFDKKKFSIGYQQRIEELLSLIDLNNFQFVLNRVFFRFSKTLIELIEAREYENIGSSYLRFHDY